MNGAAIATGYAADLALGDPRRWHPVAGFGQLAAALERRTYAPTRSAGAVHVVLLVGGAAGLAELVTRAARKAGLGGGTVLAVAVWASLGGRSLVSEARRVASLAERGEVEQGRRAVTALVGRDPESLDADGLCRAAVESVSENTADAVVSTLLWAAVGGAPAVAAYRAANTLDAMIGNRSERYVEFGWAAARLDDVLSWPGARLTALLAAVLAPLAGGSPQAAWRASRRDGAAHPSPNAGRVEAAFAGALGLQLGGTLAYRGRVEHRPLLGSGRPPTARDVRRATWLSLGVGTATALLCARAAR
jgi:adenosylcobinamide-phosphate synthase